MSEMNVNAGPSGIQGASALYTGAYARRQQEMQPEGLNISSEQSERITQGIKNAYQSVRSSGGSTKVSMSKEDIAFLCSDRGFLKMKQDAEALYALQAKQQQKIAAEKNPDDVFWNNTGDQWLTFSKALSDDGFYDGMNDAEVKDFEELLEQITANMDALSKSQYNTGMDMGSLKYDGNFFMTSAEATTALASSAAALHHLSANLIPEPLQVKFNSLIDMYQKHNEEILSEYQSPMESFNKLAAGIHQAGRKDITADRALEEHKYTVMLGNISKTEEEAGDFGKRMSDEFEKYGAGRNRADAMHVAKKMFEDYVTNNSDDEDFRRYVSEKSDWLFRGITGYWERLMAQGSQA